MRSARAILFGVLLVGMLLLLSPAAASGADYKMSSSAEISRTIPNLQPGDSVTLKNGVWTDQIINFNGHGTAQSPVTLRAETPGQVIFTGKSSVKITGEHVIVSGLAITNGDSATDGFLLAGQHCRLTESSVTDSTFKFFIHVDGSDNRVDHCYVAGKTSESPTFQIEVGAKPNHHLIDHNHFGPRPPLGRNGGETMRVGYSWQSMSNSSSVVEYNLFERCDGEIEIISSKSCDNVYRYNTFLDCAGMLTLRHGNRCRVEGNFIIAHHQRGSGGIRVIGEDHVLINNYIEGVSQGAFWITSGIENSPLKGYFRARNAIIAFNTVVDCAGAYLDLSAGFGSSERTLLPENITVADNLFVLPDRGNLLKGQDTASFHWQGNIAWNAAGSLPKPHIGINVVDPRLQRAADGPLRPQLDSPVRGAAVPIAIPITRDIDGQPRTGSFDVGADQVSNQSILNHPLSPAEVGPAWLNRENLKPTSPVIASVPIVRPSRTSVAVEPSLAYAPGKRPQFWSLATAESIMARWPDYTKANGTSWTSVNGYTLRGFEMLYRATGDTRFLDYIKRYLDQFVDERGALQIAGQKSNTLQSMITGNSLVMLYEITHEQRYKIAATTICRAFDDYPRNSDGSFWHTAALPGQSWIEDVFSSETFLTRHGKSIGDTQYANDETARQILVFAKRAEKESSGLFLHAFFEPGHGGTIPAWADPKTGLSPEVWSGGLGSYALAVVEALDLLPQNHPQRPAIEKVFRRLAAALKRTQDQKTGRWFQVVDKGRQPDNWTDTSGTAMFVYALQQGIDLGLLNSKEYGPTVANGYAGMTASARINEHGLVDISDACADPGVQPDYAHYVSCRKSVNASEAVAGFLWATTALEFRDLQKRAAR
jgi:poly(beta-D-mannuronate) lyase